MVSESRIEVARLWSFLRKVTLLVGDGLVEWKVDLSARSDGLWVQLFFMGLLFLLVTKDFVAVVVTASDAFVAVAFWKHFIEMLN